MRILIADDETPLRDWLQQLLLQSCPQADIVALAENGPAALAAIEQYRPDVAFLDIRMPGLSGLEVAARRTHPCRVVFVTAYEEFAVAAFEQAAVDYLLKPVSPTRLESCLQRLHTPASTLEQQLATLLNQLAPASRGTPQALPSATTPAPLRWLRVGQGERIQLIDTATVDFFRAADKYTEAWVGSQCWLVRTPLGELEASLAGDDFWRIHRSLIVRVAAIAEVRRDLMGRLYAHLHAHAAPLPISRAHAHRFNRD